jgi:hypothetical protein
MGFAFPDVSMNVIANSLHFWAVLKVFRIGASIGAYVLCCTRAQKGVFNARTVGGVIIYNLSVNALLL